MWLAWCVCVCVCVCVCDRVCLVSVIGGGVTFKPRAWPCLLDVRMRVDVQYVVNTVCVCDSVFGQCDRWSFACAHTHTRAHTHAGVCLDTPRAAQCALVISNAGTLHTYTHTHTRAHTHMQVFASTLPEQRSVRWLYPMPGHSTHTHIHTHTHAHTHMQVFASTLPEQRSVRWLYPMPGHYTHTHIHTHTRTHTRAHTHAGVCLDTPGAAQRALVISNAGTLHTHIHTHTHTHTHTHAGLCLDTPGAAQRALVISNAGTLHTHTHTHTHIHTHTCRCLPRHSRSSAACVGYIQCRDTPLQKMNIGWQILRRGCVFPPCVCVCLCVCVLFLTPLWVMDNKLAEFCNVSVCFLHVCL